jgi:hypothetical protein
MRRKNGNGCAKGCNYIMKINFLNLSMVTGCAASVFIMTGVIFPALADVFTIDPTRSSLTLSGSILGGTVTQQGPGSLTTSYSGTILATQSAGMIQFPGQSLITAQTNGIWQPLAGGGAGSAPADYGGTATITLATADAAFRSILLDVTSPPIAVVSGQFNPGSLTFLFPSNATSAIDYRYSGTFSGSGTKAATGNATNNILSLATITTAGTTQTITFGVNAQFKFTLLSSGDTIVNIAGQIVATNSVAAAPVVLQTPAVSNQVVTLNWESPAGQFYQVMSSSNLLTWQTNASNVTSATTNYTWMVTNAASKGFYRLLH